VKLAEAQGVAHCFDHTAADYIREIKRLVPKGFDLIVENLASTNLDLDLDMLAKFGRIVVVGSRGRLEIDPRAILQKDAVVCGMALWNANEEDVARIHATLFAGLSTGALRPVVGRQFSLGKADAAHDAVMERGAYGKIVLLPRLN
jgi:NADPH2:quinone reductase